MEEGRVVPPEFKRQFCTYCDLATTDREHIYNDTPFDPVNAILVYGRQGSWMIDIAIDTRKPDRVYKITSGTNLPDLMSRMKKNRTFHTDEIVFIEGLENVSPTAQLMLVEMCLDERWEKLTVFFFAGVPSAMDRRALSLLRVHLYCRGPTVEERLRLLKYYAGSLERDLPELRVTVSLDEDDYKVLAEHSVSCTQAEICDFFSVVYDSLVSIVPSKRRKLDEDGKTAEHATVNLEFLIDRMPSLPSGQKWLSYVDDGQRRDAALEAYQKTKKC